MANGGTGVRNHCLKRPAKITLHIAQAIARCRTVLVTEVAAAGEDHRGIGSPHG